MLISRLRAHLLDQRRFFLEKIWKRRASEYIQGQSPERNVREYFYYIDHQGMLFLDDARIKNFTSCFKDKQFLAFFFKRLRNNTTARYSDDFPYISLCGVERNFIRCDDLPIVFTKIIQIVNNSTGIKEDWFSYAHTESLMVPFEPKKLFMHVSSGRVYHPAPEKGGGIGLVRSKVAIELSPFFQFNKGEDSPPTHFLWRNEMYLLDTDWYKDKLNRSFTNT